MLKMSLFVSVLAHAVLIAVVYLVGYNFGKKKAKQQQINLESK